MTETEIIETNMWSDVEAALADPKESETYRGSGLYTVKQPANVINQADSHNPFPKKNNGDPKISARQINNSSSAPSKEEAIKHQQLILILSNYGASERFSTYLSARSFDLKPSTLKKLSTNELEELLTRVQVTVSQKNNSGFLKDVVLMSTRAAEGLTSVPKIKQRVNLDGLTSCLEQDDSFLDTVEQLQLENQDYSSMSPMNRLMLIISYSCVRTHQVNKMKARLAQKIIEKRQKENTEENSDNENNESKEPTDQSTDHSTDHSTKPTADLAKPPEKPPVLCFD